MSSLLEAEVGQQPSAVERLLRSQADAIEHVAAEVGRRRPVYAVLAARGSSDNAARYAQHVLGLLCGLPSSLATPSLHTCYGAPLRYVDALVIGISQSGASPDIVEVLARARAQGCLTVAITNDSESPLAAAAEHTIALGAGEERSVAATKTYTTSLAAAAALAVAISGDDARRRELAVVPAAMRTQLARSLQALPFGASSSRMAVLGRGSNYATAFEAALKIKELAGITAEPMSPADFLHGPIAMVERGFPILAFGGPGPSQALLHEALDACGARGGDMLCIGGAPGPWSQGAWIEADGVPEWLSPLVSILPAQRLAMQLARRAGRDVDNPDGLTKVTCTR